MMRFLPGGAYVGLFVNQMFDCVFGGTVLFAVIKLTADLGQSVTAYVEHFCC
jgi:hypothetical protein